MIAEEKEVVGEAVENDVNEDDIKKINGSNENESDRDVAGDAYDDMSVVLVAEDEVVGDVNEDEMSVVMIAKDEVVGDVNEDDKKIDGSETNQANRDVAGDEKDDMRVVLVADDEVVGDADGSEAVVGEVERIEEDNKVDREITKDEDDDKVVDGAEESEVNVDKMGVDEELVYDEVIDKGKVEVIGDKVNNCGQAEKDEIVGAVDEGGGVDEFDEDSEIGEGITVNDDRTRTSRKQIEWGGLDQAWRTLDMIASFIKENEEEWERRSRQETVRVKREEKEDRLRRIEVKKKKFGKLGKESRREKEKGEERIRRKLQMIEIKKNMWRSYRVGDKLVRVDDMFKYKEEERNEERRKKREKAAMLKDSWEAMKALICEIEENGDEWEKIGDITEEEEEKEGSRASEIEGRRKRKREGRKRDEETAIVDGNLGKICGDSSSTKKLKFDFNSSHPGEDSGEGSGTKRYDTSK